MFCNDTVVWKKIDQSGRIIEIGHQISNQLMKIDSTGKTMRELGGRADTSDLVILVSKRRILDQVCQSYKKTNQSETIAYWINPNSSYAESAKLPGKFELYFQPPGMVYAYDRLKNGEVQNNQLSSLNAKTCDCLEEMKALEQVFNSQN